MRDSVNCRVDEVRYFVKIVDVVRVDQVRVDQVGCSHRDDGTICLGPGTCFTLHSFFHSLLLCLTQLGSFRPHSQWQKYVTHNHVEVFKQGCPCLMLHLWATCVFQFCQQYLPILSAVSSNSVSCIFQFCQQYQKGTCWTRVD